MIGMGIGGTNLGTLWVRLKADTSQYTRSMSTVTKGLTAVAGGMTSMAATAAHQMKRVGMVSAAGMAAATKHFANFDDAMTKSVAIMKGVTPELREQMENLAVQISKKSITSSTELAKSYYYLASAGLNAQQSMASLATVEKFAVAGAFDMAEATDLLTDAQSALGLKSLDTQKHLKNLTRLADVLTGANTLANASTRQFSKALTTEAGAALKAYNIELEEGVAVLAAYADQGIKAEKAGTMFSRMLRLATQGYLRNRMAWESHGVALFDAAGKYRNLADVVEDLTNAVSTMSDKQRASALAQMGFIARSQQAVLPLLGAADAIRGYNYQLDLMNGKTEEVADIQLKSFASAMKIFWNQVKAVGKVMGEILSGPLRELGKWFEANQNIVTEWAIKIANGVVFMKNIFVDFVRYMQSDFGGAMSAVWTTFVDLMLEAGKTVIRIGFETGKGIFKAIQQGIFGPEDAKVTEEALKAWEALGGQAEERFVKGMTVRGGGKTMDRMVTFITHPTMSDAEARRAYSDLEKNVEATMKRNFGRMFAEDAIQPIAKSMKEGISSITAASKQSITEGSFGVDFGKRLAQMHKDNATEITKYYDAISQKASDVWGGDVPEAAKKAQEEIKKATAGIQKWYETEEGQRLAAPLQEWGQEAADVWTNVGKSIANAFDDASRSLAQAITRGKMAWKSFATSVLEDLLAIMIRAQMARAIAGVFPSVFGAGGQFPIVGATPTPEVPGEAGQARGAIVSGAQLRLVGERGPEIIAPLDKLNSLGGTPNVVVNNNTGVAMEQKGDPFFDGKQWVVDIVTKDLTHNGPIRQTMQGMG